MHADKPPDPCLPDEAASGEASGASDGDHPATGPGPEPTRRTAAQATAIAAVILASLPVVPLTARAHLALIAPFLVIPLGLAAMAAYSRSAAVYRLVLGADCVMLLVLAFGIRIWPAPLVLAPLAVWLSSRPLSTPRAALPWLRRGEITALTWYGMLATAVVSGAALIAWAYIVHPKAGPYLETLQRQSLPVAVAGLIGFGLVNAACEESAYRGLFFSELRFVVPVPVAVIVQAIGFGLIHSSGIPSGPAGMVLAGSYGLALGIIRERSRGMVAPYITHVLADTTIGLLALTVL